MDSYPVLWRDEGRPIATGKLRLSPDAALLSGAAPGRHRISETVPYVDIASIHIDREPSQRLNGNPSLVIERRGRELVQIAFLGAGLLGEVADLLTRLAT